MTVSYGQTKDFIIVDSVTARPIPHVNIFSIKTLAGTTSNEEGKIKMDAGDVEFQVTHLGYETKEIVFSQEEDSIFLVPKPVELREVTLGHYDIEKKLQFVLDHYDELYQTSSVRVESTYKESLKVNKQLARLSQVQLGWWNKDYEYNFDKTFDKQNQMSLTGVDYSRIIDSKNILTNGGFVDNSDFFQFLHLNYYPEFLISYGRNIFVDRVESQAGVTRIVFQGEVEVNGETVSRLKDCELYFDDESGGIVKVYFQLLYDDGPVEGVSRLEGIPYTSVIKSHELSLTFNRLPHDRLVLSSFHSKVKALINYQEKSDWLEMNQIMYITQRKGNKRIRKRDRIDLQKPFHENFPADKYLESKIPLSRTEMEFIKAS